MQGEGHVCPHCRGLTRTEPHPTLRFVCAACKGPKLPVPIADPILLESSRQALREAKPEGRSAFLTLAGVLYGLSTLLALMSHVTVTKAATLVIGWLTFAMLVRMRSTRSKKSELALDRAYSLAMQDYAKNGAASAKELSLMLGVPEEKAEAELVALAAENPTRIEVDDKGDVHYRVGEEPKSDFDDFDERLAQAEAKKKASL